MFTDTDSLVYEIKGKDVYEQSYLDRDLFDPANKKVLGKMKYEFKGQIISEFVSLESKMYSLISVDDKEVSKAKGVTKKK